MGSRRFRFYGALEIAPGEELQDPAVDKVHQDLDNGQAVGVLPYVALLELVALDNAKGRILKNGDSPLVY